MEWYELVQYIILCLVHYMSPAKNFTCAGHICIKFATMNEVPRGWGLYWGLDICSEVALDYESQHMKFCLKNEVMYLTSIVIV